MGGEEQGKTVSATLKILIDEADAKRQSKSIQDELKKIQDAATLSDWRKRNAVERRKDSLEEQTIRKKSHAEEMAHQRSLGLMVRTKRKEEHENDLSNRRSLALRVREGRKASREEEQDKDRQLKAEEQAHRRSLAYRVREGRQSAREEEQHKERQVKAEEQAHRRSLAFRVREGRRAMREAEQTQQRQQSARGSLAMQSLTHMQLGGVAGRVGQAQGYGSLLTSAGYGGAGGFLREAAMPLGIAAAGIGGIGSAFMSGARSDINPFADSRQKGSMFLKDYFPTAYDAVTLLNGTQKGQAFADAQSTMWGMKNSGETAAFRSARDMRRVSDTHYLRNEAYQNYNVAGLPTSDRTSAIGRVEYGEQLRLQPALQAQRKAEVDLHNARMNSVSATKLANEVEVAYNKELKAGHDLWKKGMNMPGGIGSGAKANKEKTTAIMLASEYLRNADTLNNELQQRRLAQQATEGQVVEAERGLRGATNVVSGVNLQNKVAREEHATGQATSLGGMGPAGFANAEIALQMISENGIEFATPQMISMAESIAPLTVANMKRELGEKRALGSKSIENFASADYAAYGHAGDLRSGTDKDRSELASAEVGNEKITAERYAEVYGLKWAELMMILSLKVAQNKIDQYVLDQHAGIQKNTASSPK